MSLIVTMDENMLRLFNVTDNEEPFTETEV
jgi:hypothetical protein